MRQISVTELGPNAIGAINPEARIASGELTLEELETFAQRLGTSEFYDEVGELGVNSAAGTFSMVIADALTLQRHLRPGENAADHAKRMFSWIHTHADTPENKLIIPRQCIDGRCVADGSHPSQDIIGDHDSTHGEDDCGAIKNLPKITGYIREHADVLREVAASNGIVVSDEDHRLIKNNAGFLLDNGYMTDAMNVRRAFTSVAGEESITKLEGGHIEGAARLNMAEGTTLNRDRAHNASDGKVDAFNVDVWAFRPASEVFSVDSKEVDQMVAALAYFNTAATMVLSGPSLRLVA